MATENEINRTIVVADDNPIIVRRLKTLLDPFYNVIITIKGDEALKSITSEHPSLAILDYEMPNMTGAEVFKAMKENPELSSIPVIFLTGLNDEDHVKEVLSMKPLSYLVKPIDEDRLIKTIRDYFSAL